MYYAYNSEKVDIFQGKCCNAIINCINFDNKVDLAEVENKMLIHLEIVLL